MVIGILVFVVCSFLLVRAINFVSMPPLSGHNRTTFVCQFITSKAWARGKNDMCTSESVTGTVWSKPAAPEQKFLHVCRA